jgi:gamma-butyrobetaine dioxygenase
VSVLADVSRRGFAIVPLAQPDARALHALRESASSSPFAFAARLLGVEPLFVERQPIRPVDGGRSFASTRVDTPLHTDSQMVLGIPSAIQILVCVEPAPRGGESVLLDTAPLLARLEREDPSLVKDLFEVERVQRFYFGDVRGPTVALRGGHLAWSVAPGRLGEEDPVGARLGGAIAREAPFVHALRAGEALVASNHRVLHGRRPFEGPRELVRLLVWLEEPLEADPAHVARAREVAPRLPPAVTAKLRAVLAVLRGAPPAKVASDARVDEPTLYAWRDAFVAGGIGAL